MSPLLEVKNLRTHFYTFEGVVKAVDGVSYDLEEGETLGLVGESGCGKSVLLKHITGLLRPDGGTLLVDGKDVTRLHGPDLDQVRKRFGFLFQGGALFDSMTVGENVGIGLKVHTKRTEIEIDERVRTCLQLVGLSGVEEQKPAELSGGMRKRVGLARAIATKPEILFFDEPTTGLEPIMSDVINNLIVKSVHELGATAISITHDMSSLRKIASTVAMLHDGKIVWSGNVSEIDQSKNDYVEQFIRGSSEGPIQMENILR